MISLYPRGAGMPAPRGSEGKGTAFVPRNRQPRAEGA